MPAGEVVRPGALQALQSLLQETYQIQVYREHCAAVHPLFEAHVRPTLLAHYNSTKSALPPGDRQAVLLANKSNSTFLTRHVLQGC